MKFPSAACITFGDHRNNEWEKVFSAMTVPRHKQLVCELRKLPMEVLSFDEPARTRDEINRQADELKRRGAEVLIAHTPCWTSPNLVVHGVQRMDLPTVLLGNREPGTHGCVGLFGAGGALGQIGYPHKRVRTDYHAHLLSANIMPYIAAASVKQRLKGSVFGYFGGRSIGIDTSQFDPMQWRREFGVDSEHIDQVEIIRLAGTMDPNRVSKFRIWLEQHSKGVNYTGDKLTREKLDFQIACYLATKTLIADHNLDFVAVKCMPELSNSYVPQCMTAAFLPDIFDGDEGNKEGTAMACEADADGALTQQILKIISGGSPTLFADVSHIDEDRSMIYCVNCGGLCAWYACRHACGNENLKAIQINQSVRPGGGGITNFFAASGPMQLARLYRKHGKYSMAIIPCEAVDPTPEMIDEFVQARGPHQLPAMFAKVSIDFSAFTEEFGSNHISAVAGTYHDELIETCRLLGIEPVVFS